MPRHADDHSPGLSPEPPTDPGLPIQPGDPRREPAHAAPDEPTPASHIPHQAGAPEATFATADEWATDNWTASEASSTEASSTEATADRHAAAEGAVTEPGPMPGSAEDPIRDSSERRISARIVSPKTVRVLAYVVGLALLVGGIAAVKMGHNGSATDNTSAAARDDQRASRDLVRDTASPLTSATPTGTPAVSIGASPTPTAEPSTAPPAVTKAPAPVVKKTTVKPAPPAPAAGCSGYTGNRLIACNLLPSFGFSTSEMAALDPMWNNESGWNASAENPGSGAYGIPQALPGSKMASAGSDWATNPATQIKWGLDYIKSRYGSPSAAWSFWQANGWY